MIKGSGAEVSEKVVRGKGRPRATSRDKIIEAALALAASDPLETVSVVAIARRLGIAPMAIYNYFPAKDALMQALSAALLDRIEISVLSGTPPIDAMSHWARSVRDHFLRFPELLQILDYDNGYASVAWLAHSRVLFESLEALGFSGDGLVAAIRWYWNLVMSAITVEVRETLAPVGVTDIAAAGLDSQVREVVVAIDAAVRRKGFHNQLFEFHLEMAGRALQGGIVGPSNEDQRA